MNARFCLALFGCIWLGLVGCKSKDGGGGSDDPTEYTISDSDPGVGTPLRGSMKIDLRISQSATGKLSKSEDQSVREEFTFRETMLERPPGAKKPTRSSLVIEKWETGGSGKTISDPEVRRRIVGKEILAQKFGEHYEFTNPDGSPLEHGVTIMVEEMYTKLLESADFNDFLPKKPVKRGDSWDIPLEKMTKAIGKSGAMSFDESKSKATGRLVSVSERDGRKYGKLELKATMQPRDIKGVTMKSGGKMEIVNNIELCMDGTKHDVKSDVKIDVSMAFEVPGEGISIKVEVKGTVSVSEAEEGNGRPVKAQDTKKPAGRDAEKKSIERPPVEYPIPDEPAYPPKKGAPFPSKDFGPGAEEKSEFERPVKIRPPGVRPPSSEPPEALPVPPPASAPKGVR